MATRNSTTQEMFGHTFDSTEPVSQDSSSLVDGSVKELMTQQRDLVVQQQQQITALQQQVTMMMAQMQIESMRLRQTIIPNLVPQNGVFTQIPGAHVTLTAAERRFEADGSFSESLRVEADPVGLYEARKTAQELEDRRLSVEKSSKPSVWRVLFDPRV